MKGTLLAAGRNELRGFKSSSSDVKCTYSGPNRYVCARAFAIKVSKTTLQGEARKRLSPVPPFYFDKHMQHKPKYPEVGIGLGRGERISDVLCRLCAMFLPNMISPLGREA